jgi:hypothetical protein
MPPSLPILLDGDQRWLSDRVPAAVLVSARETPVEKIKRKKLVGVSSLIVKVKSSWRSAGSCLNGLCILYKKHVLSTGQLSKLSIYLTPHYPLPIGRSLK